MTKLSGLTCGVAMLGLCACGSSDDSDSSGTAGVGGNDAGAQTGGSGGSSGSGAGGAGGAGATSAGGAGAVSQGAAAGAPSGGTAGTGATGGAGAVGGAPSGGTGTTSDAGGPVTDGTQLAACQSGDDCNAGLDCYTFGGYCSQQCGNDSDCEALSGATYTCYVAAGGFGMGAGDGGTGVCRVECDGTDDTTSCPSGMECVDVGGGGGGTFRCAYPDGGGSGTTPAFGQCQSDADCATDLSCTAFGAGNGYCTQGCQDPADCTEQPNTGSVSATCGGIGLCTLDCAGDAGVCPDSMQCQTFGGGGFAFCNYP